MTEINIKDFGAKNNGKFDNTILAKMFGVLLCIMGGVSLFSRFEKE